MMGTSRATTTRAPSGRPTPSEAVGRLVRIVREVRPYVMVSYNDFGGYGHPDHIRAALVARDAFEVAGDAAAYPEQLAGPDGLEPWAPAKRYETVLQFARLEALQAELAAQGIETPVGARATMRPTRSAPNVRSGWREMAEAHGTHHHARRRAVRSSSARSRRSGPRDRRSRPATPSWRSAPDAWRRYQPTEDFTLRVSRVGVRLPEDDLFAEPPLRARPAPGPSRSQGGAGWRTRPDSNRRSPA